MITFVIVVSVCAVASYAAIAGLVAQLLYANTELDRTDVAFVGTLWPVVLVWALCRLPWQFTYNKTKAVLDRREEAAKLAKARVVQR